MTRQQFNQLSQQFAHYAKQKIVHLHLKDPTVTDSDFFFGSVKAIFDNLTEDCIGIKYKSLTNALRGRDFYENKCCTIRVGTLITKQQKRTKI